LTFPKDGTTYISTGSEWNPEATEVSVNSSSFG
jgi:hypothetical protein